MRINYKSFPAWEFIDKPEKVWMLEVDDAVGKYLTHNAKTEEQIMNIIRTFLVGVKEVAKQARKKWIMTETFQQAIVKALPKLENKTEEILNSVSDVGILIVKDGFTLYFVNPPDREQSKIKIMLYGFTRKALTSFVFLTTNGTTGGTYMMDGIERTDMRDQYLLSIMQVLYFIKNCDIETKEIQPGQKYKAASGIKYFNESLSTVVTLDATWFTRLVSKLDINVEGFFRWQAHGPRHSLRKLIWIDGYSYKMEREAKKDKILKDNDGNI